MALCPEALNSNKRSCTFQSTYNQTPAAKKMCLSSLRDYNPKKSVSIYTSSEEEEDSEDEQSCYKAEQVRAKRRASTRVSFSTNSELSRAISQYSDEDEDLVTDEDRDTEGFGSKRVSVSSTRPSLARCRRESSINNSGAGTSLVHNDINFSSHSVDDLENLDCKLPSSPLGSGIALNFYNKSIISDNSSKNNNTNHTSNNVITPSKNSIPATDKLARSRCFEYLVGSIDEAWARYCDAATNVEDEVYGYNTPASVVTDDEEYFNNTTDITDYEESDFEDSKQNNKQSHQPKVQSFRPRLSSSASCSSLNSTKEDPSSCQLQALKDRLTKAKYYLQDLVDSDCVVDASSFWKRWDMIKYATIELVEDDDDDEIVESTIEELESGRLFSH